MIPGSVQYTGRTNKQTAHRRPQLGFEPGTFLLCGDVANHRAAQIWKMKATWTLVLSLPYLTAF